MWFLQPGMTLNVAISVILSTLLTIFAIMPLHEWAHGYVAYKLGDNTAKDSGRLTLNPLSHIDPLGAAAMILFRFGWAKPVPVDQRNFKRPKLGMALTATAGPFVNLLAAFLTTIVFNIFLQFNWRSLPTNISSFIFEFLGFFISINVSLAVFNLLPLPPLDGSKILGAFLSDRLLYKYYQYQGYITFAVFILLFTGVLSVPLNYLVQMVTNWIIWLGSLIFKV